jgi:hypothetical protein
MGSYDNRFGAGGGCLSDFKIHWHKFITSWIYSIEIFQIMVTVVDLEMEDFRHHRRGVE